MLVELAPTAQINKAFRANLLICLRADDVEVVAARQDLRKKLGEKLASLGGSLKNGVHLRCGTEARGEIKCTESELRASDMGKGIQEAGTISGDSTSNREPPSQLIIAKPGPPKYV